MLPRAVLAGSRAPAARVASLRTIATSSGLSVQRSSIQRPIYVDGSHTRTRKYSVPAVRNPESNDISTAVDESGPYKQNAHAVISGKPPSGHA